MSQTKQDTIYNEVFISYSRKDIEFVRRVVEAISESGRRSVWIDWEDIEYAEDWWQKIQTGIASAYNFVFILTPNSANSQVCYDEVAYAVESGKRIIPIMHVELTEQADFEKIHPTISQHNWLPFTANDDFDEGIQQLIETIEADLDHIRFHTRLQTRARDWEHAEHSEAYLLSSGELSDAKAWLERIERESKTPSPTDIQYRYIEASQFAEDKRLEREARITRRLRFLAIGLVSVIVIASISVAMIFARNNAELLAEAAVAETQIAESYAQATIAHGQIEDAQEQVVTAEYKANYVEWQVEYAATRAFGISPFELTQTPAFDFFATATAYAGIDNFDWEIVTESFDGVEMVLVPAGCFFMGGNEFGDERPIHEVCFEKSFWIDKYEVTNEQIGAVGCEEYSSEPDEPRNCISWFEANDYCQSRGGSLPTEAQWEYAARGSNSLIYPWGNEFIEDNVTLEDNSGDHTASVGSRPDGVSWVGAMDMAGNLWEWTSSLYEDYPYDATDGREADTGDNIEIERVLRGGSFTNGAITIRSTNRNNHEPDYSDDDDGFRCVRAYEE